MSRLRIRRLGYALSAEVRGVDLKSAGDDTIREIREAWLEHLMLCFPEQGLERDELLAFARRFGDLEPAHINADPEQNSITLLSHKLLNGRPWDGYKNGHNWHADQQYTLQITTGIFISCHEIPEAGGDTMFANMYLAYESLSPALRRIVDGLSSIVGRELPLRGMVAGSGGVDGSVREITQRIENERAHLEPPVVHPAVRVHPETGRRSLFLGPRAQGFVGMTAEESRPLIGYLNERSVAYEFVYRHRWTTGDLVMWDNRCTMHVALTDYDVQRDSRHMFRCAVAGTTSGQAYSPELEASLA